jgi:hypothetical protein
MARGAQPPQAWKMAGYKRTGAGSKGCSERPEIIARVAEIDERLRWGGTEETAAGIDMLRDIAKTGLALKTAASLREARFALIEIDRLRRQAPSSPSAPVWPPRFEPEELSTEQWLAKHAPPK